MSEMEATADHLVVIARGRLITDVSLDEFISEHSRHIVVVRSPQATSLAQLIAGPGVRTEAVGPGSLEVEGLSAEEIGKRAAARNIVLYELTPRHASLEEAFMALTRDEVEFQAGSPSPEDRDGALAA
jgi:ABC-2 type transport system ATP-binding protein